MYLISQIWGFMALAALLGFFVGWWFARSRIAATEKATSSSEAATFFRPVGEDSGASSSSLFARHSAAAAVPTFGAAKPVTAFAPDAERSAERAITNGNFEPSPLAAMSLEDLEAAVLAAGAGVKPTPLLSPQGDKPDDLKEIGGVGPTNEAWLHEQGIYHFWQIATLDARGLAWLANALPTFGKRVYRENWVDQAVRLARGELTEAKQKYLRGEQT